ncbi:hypothetical protein K503DRAFT_681193 [Rhizopogon vinicolor AM-OR11-026]|uniref:Mid2 domain-containing protein n=1 Tax=Rhizopogon vinicolor AM-OR11-026 TaxID=1314800 RepID=A0A1B7NEX5_9AGAM|nr:hypothetical protein K503DRAFT_681193 [Rhizopogon vinicolor AM-OR11-026]
MPRILVSNIALALLVYLIDFTTAGNTTCAGNLTQWYTDAVGETACVTYQRLRQICHPNYQVPNFRAVAPGDQCDDGLSFCCCNSISWGLSMLCLNCQWDVVGGPTSGIDADVGAYTAYRTLGSPSGQFCTPGTNQSFSSDIQSAVCNEGIKIADFLYNLYWDAGSCEFTMDAALKDKAASNNNMYDHCNSTTSTTSSLSTSTTSAPSQTTTATSAGSAQSSNVPTIVGAVIGGVAVLVFAAAISFCWRRHLRKVASASLDVNRPHTPGMEAVSPYTVSGES